VRTVLDDLNGTLRKTKDNHALWFEKSARKIDDLPMLNVDPELLDFGGKVSNSLRYQAQTQRSVRVQAGTVKAQTGANNVYGGTYVGPYGGWSTVRYTNADSAVIDQTARGQAQQVRFGEMKQIEDGYSQIRRRLTEKLMAEF
jgi:hypothetical protein